MSTRDVPGEQVFAWVLVVSAVLVIAWTVLR